MIRRRYLLTAARLLVAALVFAQGALAFADCDMPRRSAALVIAVAAMPCHDASSEVNLCLTHCLSEDQSLDRHTADLPAVALAAVLAVPMANVDRSDRGPTRREQVPVAASPPPRILFQSFLI